MTGDGMTVENGKWLVRKSSFLTDNSLAASMSQYEIYTSTVWHYNGLPARTTWNKQLTDCSPISFNAQHERVPKS